MQVAACAVRLDFCGYGLTQPFSFYMRLVKVGRIQLEASCVYRRFFSYRHNVLNAGKSREGDVDGCEKVSAEVGYCNCH